MAPSSSRSSKPKASDVAAEAKKHYIPLIRNQYARWWPTASCLYENPVTDLPPPPRPDPNNVNPPSFQVWNADPVDCAIKWAREAQFAAYPDFRIPLICAANERRPGGDWETGVVGYEERLCRRSTLSATLSTPEYGSEASSVHYPIPLEGGIYSPTVVVFRGPSDRYEKYDDWFDIPVVSLPPVSRPKLMDNGTKYSFEEERDTVKNKIRAALRICLHRGHHHVAIGDFGLGNGSRNPPAELARIWREVFLFDPDIRGQFAEVAFIFEDAAQSTTSNILVDIAKRSGGRSRGSSSGGSSHTQAGGISDYAIFADVFSPERVQRALSKPDPRYGLGMITS